MHMFRFFIGCCNETRASAVSQVDLDAGTISCDHVLAAQMALPESQYRKLYNTLAGGRQRNSLGGHRLGKKMACALQCRSQGCGCGSTTRCALSAFRERGS
eukprot:6120069-Pleurochrysis_carterae.AAC.1